MKIAPNQTAQSINQVKKPFAVTIGSIPHLGHDELVQLLAVLQLGVAVEKKGGVILCGLSLPESHNQK